MVLFLSISFKPYTRLPTNSESPVIVELFTSQGCSSCPAADQLLNETIQKSNSGKPVLGLSFHVSYWNHLGWKDPYSSEEFTNRQKRYADVLQLQSIYTPQMIVNGRDEFVGSDRKALEVSIARGMSETLPYQINATVGVTGQEAVVHYTLDKEPKNEWLNVALVESSVENQVLRGENQGKTLKHFNVVRKLETVAVAKTGDVNVTVPRGLDLKKSGSIILYVQDRNSMKILAAIKVNSFAKL